MRVVPVDSSRRQRSYVSLPWKIYRDDPHWVPPLRSQVKEFMDRQRNPFFRQADIEHFVAVTETGETLGRIAATIDPTHNARFRTRTGFFGFFESIDDQAVSRALLRTVEAWARSRGMNRVAGPYNYSSTQEMGLLVDGFDTTPALFQPHNPAYYADLLSAAGYASSFTMKTYAFTRAEVAGRAAWFRKRSERVVGASGFSVRYLDPGRFSEEMETLRTIFNEAFAENDEVLPIDADMFGFQANSLKAVVDPALVTIVEQAGRPVGFALMVPNANELLKRFNGRIPLSALFRWRAWRREIASVVILLIGALPSLQGAGLGRLLVAEMIGNVAPSQYEMVHTTWIHQNNSSSRVLAQSFESTHIRTYAIYERDL